MIITSFYNILHIFRSKVDGICAYKLTKYTKVVGTVYLIIVLKHANDTINLPFIFWLHCHINFFHPLILGMSVFMAYFVLLLLFESNLPPAATSYPILGKIVDVLFVYNGLSSIFRNEYFHGLLCPTVDV